MEIKWDKMCMGILRGGATVGIISGAALWTGAAKAFDSFCVQQNSSVPIASGDPMLLISDGKKSVSDPHCSQYAPTQQFAMHVSQGGIVSLRTGAGTLSHDDTSVSGTTNEANGYVSVQDLS